MGFLVSHPRMKLTHPDTGTECTTTEPSVPTPTPGLLLWECSHIKSTTWEHGGMRELAFPGSRAPSRERLRQPRPFGHFPASLADKPICPQRGRLAGKVNAGHNTAGAHRRSRPSSALSSSLITTIASRGVAGEEVTSLSGVQAVL